MWLWSDSTQIYWLQVQLDNYFAFSASNGTLDLLDCCDLYLYNITQKYKGHIWPTGLGQVSAAFITYIAVV